MLPLLASAIFGLRSHRWKWPVQYRAFSVLLICIFFVELTAILWKYFFITLKNWPYNNSNLWLYNSFLIPQYLLYMVVYYQTIRSSVIRRIIMAVSVAFTLFGLANALFIQHIHAVDSYTLVMASSMMIFVTVVWFDELLKRKEIVRLSSEPMVWIALGGFLYHAANLPYLLGLNYLIHNNLPLAIALLYVYLALNCVMYSLYTIAFLCKPFPKQ